MFVIYPSNHDFHYGRLDWSHYPEFPFWTPGSCSVYTQPPSSDPASCIFPPGAVFARQGPVVALPKFPKPGNPVFPAYSMLGYTDCVERAKKAAAYVDRPNFDLE